MLQTQAKSLYLLFIFLLFSNLSLAQTPTPSLQAALETIYIRVDPEGEQASFVVTFQQTQQFGFIVPQAANITVYNFSNSIPVNLYTALPDATTGGYLISDSMLSVPTRPLNIYNEGLAERHPELGLSGNDGLYGTRPVDVLGGELITVGRGNFNLNDVRGVISFHFKDNPMTFQIVQMLSTPTISLRLPALKDGETHFIFVGNKDIAYEMLFEGSDGSEISVSASNFNPREAFLQILAAEEAFKDLNLFDLMRQNNVNIYPRTGITQKYKPGHILRFKIQLDAPTHLSAGMSFRTIPGAKANLFLVENPDRGSNKELICPSPNQCHGEIKIESIEQGRVFVQRSGQNREYLLESWFVEPIEAE